MRKQLTPTCSRSKISVTPANWDKPTAPITKKWKIFYRYYDTQFKDDKTKWGQMFVIKKGINDEHVLADRQAIVRALINQETDLLDNRLWNPITLRFMTANGMRVNDMSFKEAMEYAFKKVPGVKASLTGLRSSLTGILKSADTIYDQDLMLSMADMPISQIKRRHIKDMLENCYNINPKFTDKRYNVFMRHTSRFYRELVDDEIVEVNVADGIRTKATIKTMKEVLTPEEEVLIDKTLKEKHYKFWRFVQIFFYADTRLTEFARLKKSNRINLHTQEFVVTVMKGSARREVEKQISNEVVHLWRELLAETKDGEYLFSVGVAPGTQYVRPEKLGNKWYKFVKAPKDEGGLGINKDLRNLNHLHLSKVSKAVGIKAASASRSHTNITTTRTRYDVWHTKDLLEVVRKSGVTFGKESLS
jgi:hypothetical protein